LGGGVAANTHIRKEISEAFAHEFPDTIVHLPSNETTTDNAAMIAVAGYFRYIRDGAAKDPVAIKANGNLSL